jgi:glutamate synthase (NADPH/NADH) large chain
LCDEAKTLVKDKNTVILVLSDRHIDKGMLPISAAIAVGAVQNV